MRLDSSQSISTAILLVLTSFVSVQAQNVHVELGKRSTAIPQVCESIVPAQIEGQVDVPALMKEANCKGSGDVLVEFTYVMTLAKREKNKKGQVREEQSVYEVYIPTLRSGTRARGVLLLTSHNGVAVPAEDLDRERLRAGERLEKAEDKIERDAMSHPARVVESAAGMLPLGTYPRTGINRDAFGIRRGGVTLDVRTFLRTCELTPVGHEQVNGRDTLVLSFKPRPDAQFSPNEKYIAQLLGTIWIDARDRIVMRLAGWPAGATETNSSNSTATHSADSTSTGGRPPAVYLEMKLLAEGTWLPWMSRINGADYPKLFDNVSYDSTITYSEYKRFNTETMGVQLETPKAP